VLHMRYTCDLQLVHRSNNVRSRGFDIRPSGRGHVCVSQNRLGHEIVNPRDFRFIASPRRYACQPYYDSLASSSSGRITRSAKVVQIKRSRATTTVFGNNHGVLGLLSDLEASSRRRNGCMIATMPGSSSSSPVFFSGLCVFTTVRHIERRMLST
jgi:hypothetical protein